MREEGVVLEDVADAPLMKWYLASVKSVALEKNAPIQTNETTVRASQSTDATEGHTLARSRWTEQHQDLAIHLKGDAQREVL
jgi:hypothetical protein